MVTIIMNDYPKLKVGYNILPANFLSVVCCDWFPGSFHVDYPRTITSNKQSKTVCPAFYRPYFNKDNATRIDHVVIVCTDQSCKGQKRFTSWR